MIRYAIIAIILLLNSIQLFYQQNNIEVSLSPLILKFSIMSGSMLILTLIISKIITIAFYIKNPDYSKYDDGKPIAGARDIADIISFIISAAIITHFFS